MTAEIEMKGENICRIKFSDGFAGICMLKGKTLAVASLVHGKAGLGIYDISSDGSIEGTVIDDYHGGGIGGGRIGKEKMTPIRWVMSFKVLYAAVGIVFASPVNASNWCHPSDNTARILASPNPNDFA